MSKRPGPSRQRVREVLDLALERPSAERPAFVAGACGDDAPLRDEVLSLLAALRVGRGLLDLPDATARPSDHADPAPSEPLTGLRFGSYQVEERVGIGGMGVVYRATDTRLGRTVAVKALPSELARDPHRRARFEIEARALAALNHPNIATIYGAEDTPRGPVLVLEYIPGRTLAELIAEDGPRGLPIDEVIAFSRQICQALEAAHAVGVVHRDLKPANIRVMPDGLLKVLDFGIAKLAKVQDPGASSADEQALAGAGPTLAGSIIGTAAYMSPEQARGRSIDRRTDMWAFGCILYELLTGSKAFPSQANSRADVAVLVSDPDWGRVPANAPSTLIRVLRRCLEKDPDRRLRDAGDARIELTEPPDTDISHGQPRMKLVGWLVAATAIVAGVLGLWIGRRTASVSSSVATEPVRLAIATHQFMPLQWDCGASFAISPDGRSIVYAGYLPGEEQGLYQRGLNEFDAHLLSRAGNARTPCFTPDGGAVICSDHRTGRLKRVDLASGEAAFLGNGNSSAGGITCTDSGSILFENNGSIWSITADGAHGTSIAVPDRGVGEEALTQPCCIPGTDVLLLTCLRTVDGRKRCSVEALNSRTNARRRIADDAWGAVWMAPDTVLFAKEQSIYAARFSLSDLTIVGSHPAGVAVLGPLGEAQGPIPAARIAVSREGTAVYLADPGPGAPPVLSWVQRDGVVMPIAGPREVITSLRLSPDRSRIAVAVGENPSSIRIRDLSRSISTRLTHDSSGSCFAPIWSRDGRTVYFTCKERDQYRVLRMSSEGASLPELVYEAPATAVIRATDTTPDGESLLLTRGEHRGQAQSDIWIAPLTRGMPIPESSLRRLFPTPGDRSDGRFSADGQLLVFVLSDAGADQVCIAPYPSLSARIQASASGGERPCLSRDGRTLFYRVMNYIYCVDVQREPTLSLSSPRLFAAGLPDATFDAEQDNSRILTLAPAAGVQTGARLGVILNFDRFVSQTFVVPPNTR